MSIPEVSRSFSERAALYATERRRLVPGFDAFYGSVVDALRLLGGGGALRRVLDLGAGTGVVSEFVASAYPEARFELLDGSSEMLSEARKLLGDRIAGVHVQDMAQELPAGPFDAVVSGLAIHHMADAEKRSLFRRVHAALRPRGLFVNAEQVLGPTPELEALYQRHWVEACLALGAGEEELSEAVERRRGHDRCADLASQLGWLREAGFVQVDCLYKSWDRATIVGVAPGSAA